MKQAITKHRLARQVIGDDLTRYEAARQALAQGNVLIAGQWKSKSDYAAMLAAGPISIPEFKAGNQTYQNVRLTSVGGGEAGFSHSSGVRKIKLIDLSTEDIANLNKTSEKVQITKGDVLAANSPAPQENAAEMTRLQEELAAARKKLAEENSSVRTISKRAEGKAAPEVREVTMKGDRAGEVREFGGIEMVWCPPGEFMMGSPENEEGRSLAGNEGQHRVSLTRGFWIAKTECTQDQWEKVTGQNTSRTKGANLPVEGLSWVDANGFLEKMNEREPLSSGWVWSFPSEAQWEYACRAGTTGPYAGESLDAIGWHDSNSGGVIQAVASRSANAWGLFDMHGNVWEWCADWSGTYPEESAVDPSGAPMGSYRVLRGGSKSLISFGCRSAFRASNLPASRISDLGFRPALVLSK